MSLIPKEETYPEKGDATRRPRSGAGTSQRLLRPMRKDPTATVISAT